MSIIDRYIAREVFKSFSIILIAVVSLFLAVDFFEKIDDFISADLPMYKALIFFLFRVPLAISLISPVGFLLAILIAFGLMNKNNELLALRSSGISAYFILRTTLVIALLFSLFLFLLNDQIVPITFDKANRIWQGEVNKMSAVTLQGKNIWLKGHRTLTHLRFYDQKNKAVSGVTLYYFDENFNLRKRVDAASGTFKNGQWTFRDLIVQTRAPDAGKEYYEIAIYEERAEPFAFQPDDLQRVVKKSEEMNFMELLAYIRTVEAEGYDATNYRVDLNAKLSFPVVGLIMALLGAGFGLKRKGRGAQEISLSIVYGIGICFLYWIVLNFCLSLGYGGMLPPLIAAWTGNFIFLGIGLIVLINVEY